MSSKEKQRIFQSFIKREKKIDDDSDDGLPEEKSIVFVEREVFRVNFADEFLWKLFDSVPDVLCLLLPFARTTRNSSEQKFAL